MPSTGTILWNFFPFDTQKYILCMKINNTMMMNNMPEVHNQIKDSICIDESEILHNLTKSNFSYIQWLSYTYNNHS